MPDAKKKTPPEYRIIPGSMPSVLESYTQIVELIARYVGRSVLATPLEFIDEVVDSMICCDRGS
jgi:energy-converting hydrogenase Eha subunit F